MPSKTSAVGSHVPSSNVSIYLLLYQIENTLRELIISLLSDFAGPRWYKTHIPADVYEDKYRRSLEYERQVKWTELIPHHPIYYCDFADLRKIIERNDNWRDVFRAIFGRKEILSAIISEIEPIRNRIAHNRMTTARDLKLVEGAEAMLRSSIGDIRYDTLVNKSTCAMDIPSRLVELSSEIDLFFSSSSNLMPAKPLPIWASTKGQWWFEEAYLLSPVDAVIDFFQIAVEYSLLPRRRGTGHQIEAWVKSHNVSFLFNEAKKQLSILINEINGRTSSDGSNEGS